MYTIGHSTRTLEEFLALLKEHSIEILVDVRRWPSSKRCPHFNRDDLERSLGEEGLRYKWIGVRLGGYRREGLGEESPNKGWRRMGFRNYADYAISEDFGKGLEELIRVAETERTVIMCAEKHYWRCHRTIISDHLTVRGHQVTHIIERGKTKKHPITTFAVFRNGILKYPEKE